MTNISLKELRQDFQKGFAYSTFDITAQGDRVPIPEFLQKPGWKDAEAMLIVGGCHRMPGSEVALDEFLAQFTPDRDAPSARDFLGSDVEPGTEEPLLLRGGGGLTVRVWGGTNSPSATELSTLGSRAIREQRALTPEEIKTYQNSFYLLTKGFLGLTHGDIRHQEGVGLKEAIGIVRDDCIASLVTALAVDLVTKELAWREGSGGVEIFGVQGDAASMQALAVFDEYAAMEKPRTFCADVARVVAKLSGADDHGHHANYLETTPELDYGAEARQYAGGDYGDNGVERDWPDGHMPLISPFRMERPDGELKEGETLARRGTSNTVSITLRRGGFMVEAAHRAARPVWNPPDSEHHIMGKASRIDGRDPRTNTLVTGAVVDDLVQPLLSFLTESR